MDREQFIEFGPIKYEGRDTGPESLLYFLSGKKMYEIGAMSGEYPPLGWRRPGFVGPGKRLGEVGPEGRPPQAAHLLSEMGGIWSHPIKAVESLFFSIDEEQRSWVLRDSKRFVNHFAYADFFFEADGLSIDRRDFVVEDEPGLFITLRIRNDRDRPVRLGVSLTVKPNLIASWFSGLSNGSVVLLPRDGLLIAYDTFWPEQWGLVLGSATAPSGHSFSEDVGRKVGTLSYQVHVPPGDSAELSVLLVAEHQRGYPAALQRFHELIGRREELFAEKVAYYDKHVFGGTTFSCSDKWLTEAFSIAKVNLLTLNSEPSPYLGRYLYAGIPEYVQLFGTDTEYAIPGTVGVNYREVAQASLLALANYANQLCGRVPHEVTTNGRVFHPGNTQETPVFAIAAWNYFKWTNDIPFLRYVYPLCREGVMEYVLAQWDMDLDYYPDGNSMVERLGMGSEKLDSACYFCRAIYCLALMAEALGFKDERDSHRELADALRGAINEDFWNDDESMWADSITEEHVPKMDGHWIVAVPMESGVADVDKGTRALQRIEKEWVNEWGMVHTKERENLVWTLPTGVLAMAEFAYGNGEMGAWLIGRITETLKNGPLGTFKELIPEGLCFVQLWSPALFLQGVIEGIFGIQPRADLDRADITPMVPKGWGFAKLNRLVIGEHRLDIHFERRKTGEKITVAHWSEGANFHCRVGFFAANPLSVVTTGGILVTESSGTLGSKRVQYVEVQLEPDRTIEIKRTKQRITIAQLSGPRVSEDGRFEG